MQREEPYRGLNCRH